MSVTPAQLALLGHDGRRSRHGWLYVYAHNLAAMQDRPHPVLYSYTITHEPGSVLGNVRTSMVLRYTQQLIDRE